MVRVKATTKDAYRLFHDGTIHLAQVEANGIRIDVDYLDATLKSTTKRIAKLERKIKEDKIWKLWTKIFGKKAKLSSHPQLAQIVYGEMGLPVKQLTDTGKPSTDASAFEGMDIPFLRRYSEIAKLKTACGTFLRGIQRETCDGFLHPSFPLHFARTYRSSSRDPNFQNFPVRFPAIAKLIRQCFIARNGHQLLEVDFSGIEVRISAAYHHDPRFIKDVLEGDMHRDMAAECFMLEKDQIDKATRQCGKGDFVFPEFYGSFYIDVARSLWDSMENMKLMVKDSDVSIKEHLAKKGIKRLGKCDYDISPVSGTFEHHIKAVEERFWNKRYKVYNKWKKDWVAQYRRKGYLDMYTGFRVSGPHKKNDITNYPIQGSAFHCLLWCLIQLQTQMNREGMRSLIVGQIHDSIVIDAHRKELDEVLAMTKEIMTSKVQEHWKWITMPLEVEAEVAPVGRSWYEKEKIAI